MYTSQHTCACTVRDVCIRKELKDRMDRKEDRMDRKEDRMDRKEDRMDSK